MSDQLKDLYRMPNIDAYEDIHLLTLSENCAALEEQVSIIAKSLTNKEQNIIKAYIDMRNDLEFETVKTALQWGKRHYR